MGKYGRRNVAIVAEQARDVESLGTRDSNVDWESMTFTVAARSVERRLWLELLDALVGATQADSLYLREAALGGKIPSSQGEPLRLLFTMNRAVTITVPNSGSA